MSSILFSDIRELLLGTPTHQTSRDIFQTILRGQSASQPQPQPQQSQPSQPQPQQPTIVIANDSFKNLEEIKEKGLECAICLNVINGTVAVTTCIHKFCSTCIHKHYETSANGNCPLCRNELSYDDIILSSELTEYLDQCIIICKNQGCKLETTRKDYYNHYYVCDYSKQNCKECLTLIYKKDEETHKTNCKNRKVNCIWCNCLVSYSLMEYHKAAECSETNVVCPSSGCNFRNVRKDMHKHIENCEFRSIVCECAVKVIFKNLETHKTICTKRKVKCQYCDLIYVVTSKKKHERTCPKMIKECNYCTESLLYEKMNEHYTKCESKPIKCNWCDIIAEKKFIDHHKFECFNRPMTCNLCNKNYLNNSNHDNICLEKPIQCEDCGITCVRKDMYLHTEICVNKIIPCKYKYIGCKTHFIREEQESHYNSCSKYHLELFETYVQKHILEKNPSQPPQQPRIQQPSQPPQQPRIQQPSQPPQQPRIQQPSQPPQQPRIQQPSQPPRLSSQISRLLSTHYNFQTPENW
jgi:hypothetical protein